jgi:hypothetical protein
MVISFIPNLNGQVFERSEILRNSYIVIAGVKKQEINQYLARK